MEQKSYERTKAEPKKIRLSSNTRKVESIFFTGDFSGCMLVVPGVFERTSTSYFTKEGLRSINFEP